MEKTFVCMFCVIVLYSIELVPCEPLIISQAACSIDVHLVDEPIDTHRMSNVTAPHAVFGIA
jgi:hypothetical protein